MIGCGQVVERFHLPALAAAPGVALSCAVEQSAERRRAMAPRLGGATLHEELDQALDAGAADAALIATPPSTHAELAARCLAAGWHVLVEKPMAATCSRTPGGSSTPRPERSAAWPSGSIAGSAAPGEPPGASSPARIPARSASKPDHGLRHRALARGRGPRPGGVRRSPACWTTWCRTRSTWWRSCSEPDRPGPRRGRPLPARAVDRARLRGRDPARRRGPLPRRPPPAARGAARGHRRGRRLVADPHGARWSGSMEALRRRFADLGAQAAHAGRRVAGRRRRRRRASPRNSRPSPARCAWSRRTISPTAPRASPPAPPGTRCGRASVAQGRLDDGGGADGMTTTAGRWS